MGRAPVNVRSCCQIMTRAGDNARRPASRLRRAGEIAGWLVPSATLALVPKCPACVAAYVALATGIGISLPTATYLRAMLLVLCVASLVLITARRLRSLIARRVIQRRSFVSESENADKKVTNDEAQAQHYDVARPWRYGEGA